MSSLNRQIISLAREAAKLYAATGDKRYAEMAFGVWVYVNQRALYRQLDDFLPKGKYTVDIYNDDPTLNTRTKVSSKTITIKSGKPITLQLQASGGAALKFTPKE